MNRIPDTVTALLMEMCPQAASVDLLAADEETGDMALQLEGDIGIALSWNEDTNHVVLTTELGQPKEFQVAEAHRMALAYNALWRETGGARVACVDPDGTLALLFDLLADGLTAQQLQYTVEQMAEVAQQWGLFMAQAGDDAPELPVASSSLMLKA
jgi:hypothetical protein